MRSCFICNNEPAALGCVCDDELKLVGLNCKTAHLSEDGTTHNMVELQIAARMLSDDNFLRKSLKDLKKARRALRSIKRYSKKLKDLEKTLRYEKEALIAEIHAIFDDHLKQLRYQTLTLASYSDKIKEFRRTFNQEGGILIQKYRDQGLRAIIETTFHSVSVN